MNTLNIDKELNDLLANDSNFKNYIEFFIQKNRTKNSEKKNFNIKRGQILYVNFGYNVLSEFRYTHYCIALHASSKKNPKVTVIPLTTKPKNHYIPIGAICSFDKSEDIERDLERKALKNIPILKELSKKYNVDLEVPAIGTWPTVKPNWSNYLAKLMVNIDDPKIKELTIQTFKNLDVFDTYMKTRRLLTVDSFARVEDITTISKARIIKPTNKNHFLYLLKASDSQLDLIDKALISLYTKNK